jgi:hypothetical protein
MRERVHTAWLCAIVRSALVVLFSMLVGVLRADACSCAGDASLAQSIASADVLFLGRVTAVDRRSSVILRDADGSVTVSGGMEPETSTFNVLRVFRGAATASVQITGDGNSCDLAFHTGETWLVYGTLGTRGIKTHKCLRTRLLSRAQPDIDYLDGIEARRPQGVVFGRLLRRGMWQGQMRLMAPERSARLVVVATSAGRRIEVDADWSSYQMVQSPGSVQLWVELDGRPVMTPIPVEVTDGGKHRMPLVVEYPD